MRSRTARLRLGRWGVLNDDDDRAGSRGRGSPEATDVAHTGGKAAAPAGAEGAGVSTLGASC